MTQDDFDSLQNIGCIPWGVQYDPNIRGQEFADYYCPEFGLRLEGWDLEVVDVPYYEENPWPDAVFPEPFSEPQPEEPAQESNDDSSVAEEPAPFTIQLDVTAPAEEPVYSEPVVDPGPGIYDASPPPYFELTLPDPVLVQPTGPVDMQEPIPEPVMETAPGVFQIELDVAAADVLQPVAEVYKPLYEEESMPDWSDLFGGVVSGAAGALTQGALSDLRTLFTTNDPAGPVYGPAPPITMDVYARALGRGSNCKISRAKNPKNPHYGKPVCRRMNPLNPKALGRAVRRLSGFQHFATKTEKAIQASFRKAGVHPARRIGGKCGTCRKSPCGCR